VDLSAFVPDFVRQQLAVWGWAVVAVPTWLVATVGWWFLGLFLRGPKHPDLQAHLAETLAEYPPPPPPGPRRLTVLGQPVRVRLVVVAPVGTTVVSAEAAESLLDEVYRGLGAVIARDKPRVKVWPRQLSNTGFAPTFHRLVQSPDAPGSPSRWVLAAGVARAGQKPFLLGLALLADGPSTLGQLTFEPKQWAEQLQIQVADS
jgi:hypothetical protein